MTRPDGPGRIPTPGSLPASRQPGRASGRTSRSPSTVADRDGAAHPAGSDGDGSGRRRRGAPSGRHASPGHRGRAARRLLDPAFPAERRPPADQGHRPAESRPPRRGSDGVPDRARLHQCRIARACIRDGTARAGLLCHGVIRSQDHCRRADARRRKLRERAQPCPALRRLDASVSSVLAPARRWSGPQAPSPVLCAMS